MSPLMVLSGYFLSCAASKVDIALAIGPVILLIFMLFGGFYLNTGFVFPLLLWLLLLFNIHIFIIIIL